MLKCIVTWVKATPKTEATHITARVNFIVMDLGWMWMIFEVNTVELHTLCTCWLFRVDKLNEAMCWKYRIKRSLDEWWWLSDLGHGVCIKYDRDFDRLTILLSVYKQELTFAISQPDILVSHIYTPFERVTQYMYAPTPWIALQTTLRWFRE